MLTVKNLYCLRNSNKLNKHINEQKCRRDFNIKVWKLTTTEIASKRKIYISIHIFRVETFIRLDEKAM